MNDNTQDYAARASGATMGFILGAAVGAGLALLLAPATGADTRRRLGQTAKRWGSNVRDGVETARSRINDNIHGLKDDVEQAVSSGRDAFSRSRESRGSETSMNPNP